MENRSKEAGESMLEGIIILAVVIIIMIITPKGGSDSDTNFQAGSSLSKSSGENKAVTTNSSYTQEISLGTGNASYAYQPYEEYITIYNVSGGPVDITNWQLKNAKDKRAYDGGGALRYFPADTATIPQATAFISPLGHNIFQNAVLKAGEEAIVTTGQIGSQSPYKIVSFKENVCSGYLEDLPEYAFTPPLTSNCPRPADEPGVNALGTECRSFIERMPSCQTPKFNTRDRDGDPCTNCVNGTPLPSTCIAFIKNHFNYPSCLAYHQSDSNFSGRTWRIFLGKGWEMWAERYENIQLFDRLGQLVKSYGY